MTSLDLTRGHFWDYGENRPLVGMIPLFGDIFLKAPIKLDKFKIVPYGIVGFGIIFWDFDESSLLETNGISVSIDPGFGMKFGGGIDFFVTENIAIFGEGSFIWSDADATAAAKGTVAAATIDTDTWLIGGGIKYVF